MKTRQVNMRIEPELLEAVQHEADAEFLDRGTMVRKLLREAMANRRVERALLGYQRGDISLGRACEDSGISHWRMLELLRARGVGHWLTSEDAEYGLDERGGRPGRVADARRHPAAKKGASGDTSLPDRPPGRGGVLLVGVNPAPVSVRVGHYYQGRLGKRLWKRLTRLGLLSDPTPGREDDAFVAAGHGLTDVAKRATKSAKDLTKEELRHGAEVLREKIRRWGPGTIVFVYRDAARATLGTRSVAAGPCGAVERVPAFLLCSPYSTPEHVRRNDQALLRLIKAD